MENKPSLSYSMLSTALRCGALYRHIYVDKIPQPGKFSGDMAFGSSIHHALEMLLTQQLDPVPEFMAYFSSECKKDLEFGRYKQVELEEQGKILLTRFKRMHSRKINVYQMEQRLHAEIINPNTTETTGFMLEGTPDVLGDFEGIPSIIDFKTSGYRYENDKVKISEQMYLYSLLARHHGYVAEQLVYVVLIKGKNPSIQILKHKIDYEFLTGIILPNIMQQYYDVQAKIKNKSFTRNMGSCIMGSIRCAYFKTCWGE